MAEALAVAGSVAGIVSLAGQIAQGAIFLHGFLKDITEAPAEIENLRIELDQYRILYEGLEKLFGLHRPCVASGAFDDLQSALIPCKAWTDRLVRKVERYNLQQGSGVRRKLWSQVRVAISKQQYRDYLATLERAKLTLIAMQTTLNTTILLTRSPPSSQQTSAQFTASSDTLPVTESVCGDVSTNSSGPSQEIGISSKLLTETRDLSRDINSGIHELLAILRGNVEPIETAMRTVLEQKLQEINNWEAGMGGVNRTAATHIRTLLAGQNAECPRDPTVRLSPLNLGLSNVGSLMQDPPSSHSGIRSRTTGVRKYTSWFGSLVVVTKASVRAQRSAKSPALQALQQTTETGILFVPAGCLTTFAMSGTFSRIAAEYRKPRLTMTLEPLRVIHELTPIATAIRSGDIAEVQDLLRLGHAALSDRFPDGATLVDACILSMFKLWEVRQSKGYFFIKYFSPEVLQKWSRLVHLAEWLLQQGVDAGAVWTGSRPSGDQFTFYKMVILLSHMEYFEDERHMVEHDLNRLGELMLRTAKNNPIDVLPDPVHISNLITDYVYHGIESRLLSVLLSQRRWSFDWMTLKRSNGQLLLDFLFAFTWSDAEYGWIYRERGWHSRYLLNRSTILKRLVGAAVEAKDPTPLDQAGCPVTISKSIFAVDAAIRRALYEIRPKSTHERASYIKWIEFRESTITDVATLLGYDASVMAVRQRGETLTESAWRWEVVGIWKQALCKAGYDADSLVGLDTKPTELYECSLPPAATARAPIIPRGAWGTAAISSSKVAVFLEFPHASADSCLEELSWEMSDDESQLFLREPGLTSMSCDISRHGGELCFEIHEACPTDEKAQISSVSQERNLESSESESSVDNDIFRGLLRTAGSLLSTVY